jgi:sporulation protein YlmC with PRC-barrel domain
VLVGFHLLDRQVIDHDGLLVGKVDDVELSDEDPPRIVALLLGPQALGQRMGGRLGRVVAGLARWLHTNADPLPGRIPYEEVAGLDTAVHLRIPRGDLPRPPLEGWLCDNLIDRIPGATRAGE